MTNVVEFTPLKNKKNEDDKVEQVSLKLNSMIEALNSVYGHVVEVEKGLERMNYECGRLEQTYDQTLDEYATLVGVDKVPQEFLEYSQTAEPVLNEDGSLSLTFIGLPKEEI